MENNEFLYLLGVVAVGFVLTFALRALPFLIFGTRKGELPGWVRRFGDYVSPVIIAALIVYSYSGLAWKTAWPYLAGFVTVAIHVWRRNPLASIVAGTALYMCLLACGCTTTSDVLQLDAAHPSIRYSVNGFLIGNRFVDPREIPGILKDREVPRTSVIHILVDEESERNLKPARAFMNLLAQNGYTRSMLVTKKTADSHVLTEDEIVERERQRRQPQTSQQRVRTVNGRQIRYKGANE